MVPAVVLVLELVEEEEEVGVNIRV